MTEDGNLSLETINRKTSSSPAGLDFEYMARCCLKNGWLLLSADQIKFIGAALQQIPWCGLTTSQSNRLLDLTIMVREGAQ